MALAIGQLSKTKSQVSDIRTIGPLVIVNLEIIAADEVYFEKYVS